jgi:hypothetical protein
MLRGVEHKRPGSGDASARRQDGLGAVVPVPLVAPKRRRSSRRSTFRLLTTVAVVGAFSCGLTAAVLQLRASEAAAMAECTALALDRDAGRTFAGPCTDAASWLPGTLTALFFARSADAVAAP